MSEIRTAYDFRMSLLHKSSTINSWAEYQEAIARGEFEEAQEAYNLMKQRGGKWESSVKEAGYGKNTTVSESNTDNIRA